MLITIVIKMMMIASVIKVVMIDDSQPQSAFLHDTILESGLQGIVVVPKNYKGVQCTLYTVHCTLYTVPKSIKVRISLQYWLFYLFHDCNGENADAQGFVWSK